MAEQAKKTTAVVRRVSVDMSKALVILDSHGKEARLFNVPVELSVESKTLVQAQQLGTLCSADGYGLVAGAAGIQTHFPETVVANGREQPNGYCDPETETFFYKAQAWGFTKTGQLIGSEATVSFNLRAYLLQDLIAKQQSHPQAFRLLPKEMAAPGDTWAGYKVDDALILWLDTSYPEAFKWMKDQIQQRKFGQRKAETMARRNAISAHPTVIDLGLNGDVKEARITVNVPVWFTKEGPLRLDGSKLKLDMSKALAAGNGEVASSKVIDVTAEVEQREAARAETSGEEPEPGAEKPADKPPVEAAKSKDTENPKETDVKASPLLDDLKAILRFKPKTFAAALKTLGLAPDTDPADLEDGMQVKLLDMLKTAANAKK